MKPPAFQFYADDFIGGTITMSHEERGLYILLLCLQWTQGSVSEEDIKRLGLGLANGSVIRVRSKFVPDEVTGALKNARLEAERAKQDEYRRKQAENGKLGGRPKTQAYPKPNPTANPNHNPNITSPSPSPSPTLEMSEGAEIEPPPGFPKSEAEAVTQASFIGATPEHAAKCYNLAVSRGYRDAKGNLIRNFRSYLKVTQSYEHDRIRNSSNGVDRNKGYNANQSADALARKVL